MKNSIVLRIEKMVKSAKELGKEADIRFQLTAGPPFIAHVLSVDDDHLEIAVSGGSELCVPVAHIVSFRDVTASTAHVFEEVKR